MQPWFSFSPYFNMKIHYSLCSCQTTDAAGKKSESKCTVTLGSAWLLMAVLDTKEHLCWPGADSQCVLAASPSAWPGHMLDSSPKFRTDKNVKMKAPTYESIICWPSSKYWTNNRSYHNLSRQHLSHLHYEILYTTTVVPRRKKRAVKSNSHNH